MLLLYDFLWCFFIYGLLGWCTEVAFAAVKSGKFVNRGFLNGPICPVYGVGVGIVVFLLYDYRDRIVLLYVLSTILVTFIEWLTGYLMDKIFHHKWWDYSHMPLNIGGYVCLLFSLVWGVACVFIVKVIHPLIARLVGMIPFTAGDLVRFSRRNLRGYLCDDSSGIEDESSFRYDGKSGRRAEGVVRQAGRKYLRKCYGAA